MLSAYPPKFDSLSQFAHRSQGDINYENLAWFQKLSAGLAKAKLETLVYVRYYVRWYAM